MTLNRRTLTSLAVTLPSALAILSTAEMVGMCSPRSILPT